MSAPAEPIIEMPDVDIDAPEPVPDTRLVPDVRAADDDVRVVNDESSDVDDEDDIDEAVEASPASGIPAPSGVDIAVVSGATVCALVPAEVPAAWAAAAACAPNPPGLVLGSGGVKGVNVDAVCAAA